MTWSELHTDNTELKTLKVTNQKNKYGSHVWILVEVTFTCRFGAHDWHTIVSNMLKKAK